jgi:pimeloyl-ACP methyl ester carboxylesterase
MTHLREVSRGARLVLLVGLLAAAFSGCIFRTVKEQQREIDVYCQMRGEVKTAYPSQKPLVVGLVRLPADAGGEPRLADHFVLEAAGRFFFQASPGRYALGAFEDRNADLRYESDEPGLPFDPARAIECAPGDRKEGIALVIQRSGRLRIASGMGIAELQARSAADQVGVSLGQLTVLGDVAALSDPRFSRDNASKGMWKPLDFVLEKNAGVWFLEPYDAAKTPVLFVHGILGTPLDFEALIAGLDRSRFQPWFYYYPSGGDLDRIAEHLTGAVNTLRVRHRFDRLFVVAHSMGGLVSRAFILREFGENQGENIPLFVSLSSPWGGMAAAQAGVEHAPAVVRSWYGVASGSEFLRRLFYEDPDTRQVRRHLPPHVVHHLMFGFHRNARKFGESSDETVPVASQLEREAQEDATRVHGFDSTHTGILRNPDVSKLLNQILADAR